MRMTIEVASSRYLVDLETPLYVGIPVNFHGRQPSAFYQPPGYAVPVESDGFVGDVRRGGSCNCETVTFCPHVAGTHTEGVGHISHERLSVHSLLTESLLPASVLTVEPEAVPVVRFAEDYVITLRRIQGALTRIRPGFSRAVLLRTLPNEATKQTAAYSSTNPPYLAPDAVRALLDAGVEHLLVDLPSLDREKDGGRLLAHRTFWEYPSTAVSAPSDTLPQGGPQGTELPPEAARHRTVTELIYVPESIADGPYLLNLQIAPFVLDAAPARPILYPVQEEAS